MKTRKILLAAMTIFSVMLFSACEDDPCDDVTCLNGGVCVDGDCNCTTGYEGSDCGTLVRTKFLGNYTANDGCTVADYSVQIDTSSAGKDKVIVRTFGKYDCSGTAPNVVATVNGNDLTFDSNQPFCAGQFSINSGSGSMSASGNVITITYQTTLGTSSPESCTSVLTRQ